MTRATILYPSLDGTVLTDMPYNKESLENGKRAGALTEEPSMLIGSDKSRDTKFVIPLGAIWLMSLSR